jgi:hypothetical protein
VKHKLSSNSEIGIHEAKSVTDVSNKILLSGASGLIGANLVRALAAKRIQTFQLVRKENSQPDPRHIVWNPKADPPVADLRALEGFDAAIHLSGANISSHRWTESYKREIVASRVDTTRALARIFQGLKQPPKALLCASATGIYGDCGDELLTEASAPGKGFLADTCARWEAAANTAKDAGVCVVHLRFGVVFSRAGGGGALGRMLPIFRLGAGGRLGSGRQWMGWIAMPDVINAIEFLIEKQTLDGPINMVAPNPVTNRDFTAAFGRALHRPTLLPVPAFALRLAVGEIADEALLASNRAVPQRLLDTGFEFRYPEIGAALRAML